MERWVAKRVADLDDRNRGSAEINRMSELLQSCRDEQEIFTVAARTAKALFPGDSGRSGMLDDDGRLRPVSPWSQATMSLLGIDGVRAVIRYDPENEMFRGEYIGLNGSADFYARDTGGAETRRRDLALGVSRDVRKEWRRAPERAFGPLQCANLIGSA